MQKHLADQPLSLDRASHDGALSDDALSSDEALAIDGFRLLRPLGRGGMGQVYLAEDLVLERQVAVKFILGPPSDGAARAAFLRESRAIARLCHPNVVTLYSFGESAGRPYQVSEYLHGRSLAQIERPLSAEGVIRIGIDLARGLAAAHSNGILHRDLKPQNAIRCESGICKLIDFGLAHLVAAGTPTPALAGTPRYLAPELLRGDPPSAASDLFALGLLLRELWTGVLPADESTGEVVPPGAATLAALPHTADPLSTGLAALIERCVAQHTAARVSSAEELALLLCGLSHSGTARDQSALEEPPYRGLRPFEDHHSALFFGRDMEIRDILEQLRGAPLVVVTGPSGIGKSSLCRAGVLPQVAAGGLGSGRHFLTLTLRPGVAPLAALREALTTRLGEAALPTEERDQPDGLNRALRRWLGPRRGILLFIDQAEELLTQSPAAEAEALLAVLWHLCAPGAVTRVLLAVRDDYLLRLSERARQRGFAGGLLPASLPVGPLGVAALRQAIALPALRRGYTFEGEDLFDALVAAGTGVGALPLLQFTLDALWQERDTRLRQIPAAALERLGGVSGALSRHADGVIARLAADQQQVAWRLLDALVLDEETQQRRDVEELTQVGGPATTEVLDALVTGRLLLVRCEGEAVRYELAHEALLRGWEALALRRASEGPRRAVQRRLLAAASEWARLGRSSDLLWSEPQLAEAKALGISVSGALDPNEVDFLTCSQARERRQRWRRRAILLGGPALLGMVLLGGVALQKERALRARSQLLAQEELGLRARELAQRPGQEVEALLAGLRAVARPGGGLDPAAPAAGRAGLWLAVTQGRRALPLRGHRGAVRWLEFSPDGARLLSVSDDHDGRLWDTGTGALLAVLPTQAEYLYHGAFSPDGRVVLTTPLRDCPRLFDGRTGQARHCLSGPVRRAMGAAFSPDGALLAVPGGGGVSAAPWIDLYEVDRGRLVRSLPLPMRIYGANAAVFTPDNLTLLVAAGGAVVRRYRAPTWTELPLFAGHAQQIVRMALDAEGRRLATASEDETARLWDTSGSAAALVLRGHHGALTDVAFTPAGRQVLTCGKDGTARVWDAVTGAQQQVLQGHPGQVLGCAVSPDGARALTAGDDGTARLWSIATGALLATLGGHHGALYRAVFSADGRRIATAGDDHTIRLWHGQLGTTLHALRGHRDGATALDFSADGALLVSAADETIRLWDGRRGAPTRLWNEHTGPILLADFAPQGPWLATADAAGTLSLFDASQGTLRWRRRVPGVRAMQIELLSQGPLAVREKDGALRLFDLTTGALLSSLPAPPADRDSFGYRSFRGAAHASELLAINRGHAQHLAVTGSGVVTRRTELLMPTELQPESGWLSGDRRGAFVLLGDQAGLWELPSGRLRRLLAGSPKEVWCGALSADGALAATGGIGGAQRWDVASGAALGPVLPHQGTVTSLAFSPDGRRLLSTSYDHLARLWDAQSGALLATLRGHRAEVTRAVFSPDGRRVATAGLDYAPRLWDGESGAPVRPDEDGDLLDAALAEDEEPTLVALAPAVDPGAGALPALVTMACRLLRGQSEAAQVAALCAKAK